MKKILIKIVIPALVTLVIILIFFKDISLHDIKVGFLKIPILYLVLFILLSLAGTLLRALKYYILLSKKISYPDLFLITLVRNFSVDLLPARTASLVLYSYFTARRGLPLEEGASSFVVSMFYDSLALCLMLGLLLFFLETEISRTAIYIGMG
ncbi:MAG: lysylphosphatidylglycerol synthase domain-containing protein, partial [Candidatus Aminicenantes bacterium]|nr:lysylphosphatidylglycerol synthase domain-containing protein [Candidatus Aminicenantes bacterium]